MGGRILFEEPLDRFKWRRYRPYLGVFVLVLVMASMIPFSLLLPPPAGSSILQFMLAFGGILGALALLGLHIELPRYGNVTPLRLFENGISTGFGDHPYRPLTEVYAIENALSSKRRVPFTVVTFWDGNELTIAQGGLSDPMIMVPNDYLEVVELIRARSAAVARPHLEWDAGAEAFIANLPWLKGPTRARTESLARAMGLDRVELGFLASNWKQIGESHAVGVRYFRERAKIEFGSSPIARARQVERP